MLQCKSKKIFSELSDFLTSGEKVISQTIDLYRSLKLDKIQTGIPDYPQATFRKSDILLAQLLMPLFGSNNPMDYNHSWLKKQFEACSATLYRFRNDMKVNWRSICQQVNHRLVKYVAQHGTFDNDSPRCIIVDDTDLRKSGRFIEHVGKIWSHVGQRSILGFKGLFVGYWDSKSFMGIDFSLHKEKGKNLKRPFGMPKKILKKQFHKNRDRTSPGAARVSELLINKIDIAIAMIDRAIKANYLFEYILVDSWFTCDKLVKFANKQKVHIIGMGKMGNTKYQYASKELSAAAIVEKLRRNTKPKYYKRLGLYVLQCEAELKGTKVKLFFCRNTKRGKWHMLLTTNNGLTIEQAYRIYSIRWGIEVFFKETKQHFALEGCQSQDFDAQVADISKAMIHYNIFSLIKRVSHYETLGELFREIQGQTIELTLCKRIWGFILEIMAIIADVFEINPEDLICQVFEDDDKKQRILNIITNNALLAA